MAAFLVLGLFVGLLVGMTKQSVVATIIPLFLTFAGGSAIAFISKNSLEVRRSAEWRILAISAGGILGVFAAIFLSDNQLLTLSQNRVLGRTDVEARKYLRSGEIEAVFSIDEQVRNGRLTKQEAYDKLIPIVRDKQ